VRVRLVNKVVPHDRLVPEYESLATSLAKRAPLAVAVCKRLLTKEAGAHYRESENVMPEDSCPVKTEVQFALSHVWHARSAWKGSLDTVVARQYSKASTPGSFGKGRHQG